LREVKVATVGSLVGLGLLGGALVGCSVSPGDAAVVAGRHISQDYLDATARDLRPLLSDPSPSSVLSVLVVAPTFIDAAAEQGVGSSPDEAMALLEQSAAAAGLDPVPAFGDGAVEIALFSLAMQDLQALDDGADVVAQIQALAAGLDVTVNPRYGVMDPATGQISPTTPDWIVPVASDAP